MTVVSLGKLKNDSSGVRFVFVISCDEFTASMSYYVSLHYTRD